LAHEDLAERRGGGALGGEEAVEGGLVEEAVRDGDRAEAAPLVDLLIEHREHLLDRQRAALDREPAEEGAAALLPVERTEQRLRREDATPTQELAEPHGGQSTRYTLAMHRLAPLLLLGACASVEVRAGACREGDAIRACFRRMEPGTAGYTAALAADAGQLTEITHSPDRLSVSVSWKGARGKLRCAFPYGGAAELDAGEARASTEVEYVFLEQEGVRVSALLPSACPMRARIAMTVEVAPALSPASIAVEGMPATRIPGPRAPWMLTLAEDGMLAEGEIRCTILCADGVTRRFLVGIDADGTPSATTGFVRNW